MKAEEQHIIDELKKRPAKDPGEDYFARLKVEVMEKITEESTLRLPSPRHLGKGDREGGKTLPLHRKTWFQIAAAASVVLILTLFALNGNEAPQRQIARTEQPDWNSVSQEEVLAYIDENIDDFETEAIAQQLDSIPAWSVGGELAVNAAPVNPKAAKAKTDQYDELFKDIDQEDILEYLEDEGELDEELFF